MINRLGTFAAACALIGGLLPALSAPASAATVSKTAQFDINATVSALATISFATKDTGSTFKWGASDFQQFNSNAFTAADNNPGTISGSFRTSNTGGGGSITFTAPATITGTNGGTLTVANVMKFTCAGSYQVNNADGTVGTAQNFASGGTSSQSAVSTSSNSCATLPVNTSAGAFSIPLSLYLNGDSLAADQYNTSGGAFVITISAT
jgi:hypothetical protein